MQGFAFAEGKIVPTDEARIRIDDLGVLRGFAIYEGITVINGKPFMLKEHLDRFERSAQAFRMTNPYSREEVADILDTLSGTIAAPRGDIRMLLTGGITDDGIVPSQRETFFAIANPLPPLPEGWYRDGAKVIAVEHKRTYPSSKTTNYITAVMKQADRLQAGAQEIIYTHDGYVLEASTSNAFIVKDGTIITPKDDILYGITRMKMLELARDRFPVEERAVTVDEFFNADETFLTSSFKDVLPIVKCDETTVGGGAVGPITKVCMELYAQALHHSATVMPEMAEEKID